MNDFISARIRCSLLLIVLPTKSFLSEGRLAGFRNVIHCVREFRPISTDRNHSNSFKLNSLSSFKLFSPIVNSSSNE